VHVTLDELEADKLLKSRALTCVVTVDGTERTSLVRDADRDCLTDRLVHVDFLEVNPESQVTVEVPLSPWTINCPGIKAGGLLEQMVRKIKVRTAVASIPESISVDLSSVGIAETVYAKDVPMPEGVTLVTPERTALMSVLKTRAMKKAEAEASKQG
jgi:large subunit ribosomal protein L25